MALIDQDEAEIITSHKQVTAKGNYWHTEWSLIAAETLYVLGEHATIGGTSSVSDFMEDVTGLLAEWKLDQAGLLRRFDLDGDYNISMEEWDLAREAANQ